MGKLLNFTLVLSSGIFMLHCSGNPTSTQDNNPGDVIEIHGTMVYADLEGGCWSFVSDSGISYSPLQGPEEMYIEGQTGTMTAVHSNQGYGICMWGGEPVEVLEFRSD
jgi:hypothetical protein